MQPQSIPVQSRSPNDPLGYSPTVISGSSSATPPASGSDPSVSAGDPALSAGDPALSWGDSPVSLGIPPIAGGQPMTQVAGAPAGTFTCATGTIQPQSGIGIPFAGQFFLVNPLTGQRLAALSTDQVNLTGLVGQPVTVCGVSQGQIEGLTTLRVTSATPVGQGFTPAPTPNPQTLQQLLLQLIMSNPALLLQLCTALQSGGAGAGLGSIPGTGVGSLGGAPLSGFPVPMAGGQNPFGVQNPFGAVNPFAAGAFGNPFSNPFGNGSVAGIPLPQGINGNL